MYMSVLNLAKDGFENPFTRQQQAIHLLTLAKPGLALAVIKVSNGAIARSMAQRRGICSGFRPGGAGCEAAPPERSAASEKRAAHGYKSADGLVSYLYSNLTGVYGENTYKISFATAPSRPFLKCSPSSYKSGAATTLTNERLICKTVINLRQKFCRYNRNLLVAETAINHIDLQRCHPAVMHCVRAPVRASLHLHSSHRLPCQLLQSISSILSRYSLPTSAQKLHICRLMSTSSMLSSPESSGGYEAFGSFHTPSTSSLFDQDDAESDIKMVWESDIALQRLQLQANSVANAPNRSLFALDLQKWTYLNHGAFGAPTKVAIEAAAHWRALADAQPLNFNDRELFPLVVRVIKSLAGFIGVSNPKKLVLLPNATAGLHSVLASVLRGEDKKMVVLFSTRYGAVRKMLQAIEGGNGSVYVHEEPLSLEESYDDQKVMERLEKALDAVQASGRQVTLVVVDHITSNTAVTMPVKEIVQRCHDQGSGIPVLVDGAHGLLNLPLDLDDIGADYYVGNCHKWFCSTRGAAFLHVARENGPVIEPRVISHGFFDGMQSAFMWTGLQDYSAWLALPQCLAFWRRQGVTATREYMHSLAQELQSCCILDGRCQATSQENAKFHSTSVTPCVSYSCRLHEGFVVASLVQVDRQVYAELLRVAPGNPGSAAALVSWSAFDNALEATGGTASVEAYEVQYAVSGSGAWQSLGDSLTGYRVDLGAQATDQVPKQRIFTRVDAGETISDGDFRLTLSYEGSSQSLMGGRAMAGVVTPPIAFDASEDTMRQRSSLWSRSQSVAYDGEDPLPLLSFYEVTGLQTGKAFTFRVRAQYSYDIGWSSWSASSEPLEIPATRLPRAPSAPEFLAATTSHVTISWRMRRELTQENGIFAKELFPVTSFHAQQQCDSEIGWTTIRERVTPGFSGNSDTFSTVVASLERPPGSTCVFRVAATNVNGQGPYSLASAKFTTFRTAPGPVLNLRVLRDPLTVIWETPADLGGHTKEELTCDVEYRTTLGSTWTRLPVDLVDCSKRTANVSMASLKGYTAYVARVRAVVKRQAGSFSQSAEFLTDYTVEEESSSDSKDFTLGTRQVAIAATRQHCANQQDWYYVQMTGNGGSGGSTNGVQAEPGENGAVLVFPVTWSGERLAERLFFFTGGAQTYRVPVEHWWWGHHDGRGGFNGGGNGGTGDFPGGGGGGASEVRVNGRIVLVAAGGGGAGSTDYCCAHGGGGGGLDQAESGLAADATAIPLDLSVTGQADRDEYHSSNVAGDTRDFEDYQRDMSILTGALLRQRIGLPMVNVDVVVVDKAANKQVEEQVEGSLVEEEEAQASTVLEGGGSSFVSFIDLFNSSKTGISDARLRPRVAGEAVRQLQVSPLTSSSVSVSWKAPRYGFSQLVEGFVIEMANRSASEDFRLDDASDANDASTWGPQALNDLWELSISSTTAKQTSVSLDSRQPTTLSIPDGGEVFALGRKRSGTQELSRRPENDWHCAVTRAFPVLLRSPEEAADKVECTPGTKKLSFVSTSSSAGVSGTPLEALSVFHQLPVAGNWTLELADTAADGLVGTLESWDVAFDVAPCVPAFTWTNLSPIATGTAPTARFQHSVVVFESSMFVFGGSAGGSGVELSDLYRLDYTPSVAFGVAPTARWTQLASLTDSESPSIAERRVHAGRVTLLTPYELMGVGRGLKPPRRASLGSNKAFISLSLRVATRRSFEAP
ncbi:Kelch-type beta propeller [Phytophthora cactorum]|nr:Kelch-type beta propeller [Phytophthora cactorum]